MAYEKQTWANGDVITAEKLNHMEDGIAGSSIEPLEITITYDSDTETYTANKTYEDFYEEWVDCSEKSTDLDQESAPCTITYTDGSSSLVYNGLAVITSWGDANPGFGLGLIMYLEGNIEYIENRGYSYVKWVSGFIFYQHQADDVIINLDD